MLKLGIKSFSRAVVFRCAFDRLESALGLNKTVANRFRSVVFNGLNRVKGSLPSVKGSSVIQVHVSGVGSKRIIVSDRDRTFNTSREAIK